MTHHTLCSLVFCWLAIPWIQAEADEWVMLRNRTAPQADRNKLLPHGIPELMRQKPEKFGAVDFKVCGGVILTFLQASSRTPEDPSVA
jgi:hypothetical protein